MYCYTLTKTQLVVEFLGRLGKNITTKRYLSAIAGLSANDVKDLCEKGEPIEAICHFCNAAYTFEPEEIMTEYVKKIQK